MRGKVLIRKKQKGSLRITPAYAGKRRYAFQISIRLKDHPRLCGEKYSVEESKFVESRITPAYAGKRFLEKSGDVGKEDHPRLCGEKTSLQRPLTFPKGSPPPMRGKGTSSMQTTTLWRITPAYAGKREPEGTGADTA